MALDVYYKEDILNALRGLHVASGGPATLALELLADPEMKQAIESGDVPLEKLLKIYQQGFNTALAAVGLSFGLVPTGPEKQIEASRQPAQLDGAEVLELAFLRLVESVKR